MRLMQECKARMEGMTMYEELVTTLRRQCAEMNCGNCNTCVKRQAADAIEELTLTVEKIAEYFKRWTPAAKRLPEKPGEYEVYIKDPFFKKGESVDDDLLQIDTSYVTTAYYDPNTGLWKEYADSYYNAHLDNVNTKKEYHITHWRPMPEPPEEE